ncbi:unnamed protein product [Aphanomyces euteiches]
MATSATGVVERVRLEVETLRRESLHWHLHPLPEITLQALIKSSGGLGIIVDLLPSPELELPEDPTTIELIVGLKYGVNPPVVRCCGTFLHALCDPSTRQMDLPMLKRAERGWSKSYSLSAVLHALRRSFLRRGSDSSLNLWELRSKHLQHLETKYHIDSPQVVVGQCRSAGAASVGARDVMEDAYVCVEQLQCDSASMLGFHPAVYCIADGHAGSECANFLVRTLPSAIGAHLARDKSPRESLWRAFTDVDLDFTKWAVARNDTSGSTCICILFDGLDKLYCANVGDSRALLIRGKHVVQLSRDHRSIDVEEQALVASKGTERLQSRWTNLAL